jgi:L-iditol 2-dehydrogenase
MKAAFLEKLEIITVREVPQPVLEPGSVLVRVKVCAICSTDLRTYHYGSSRTKLPHVLGHEIAGEIAPVSDTVSDYRVGQRVTVSPSVACGQCFYCQRGQYRYCERRKSFGGQFSGGYAEYLLVPAPALQFGALHHIPEGVSFDEAALSEPLSCCLRGQRMIKVSDQDTVVVVGGGPIGILHCRLARVNQASPVILVEKRAERLKLVNLEAIDQVIDYTSTDVSAEIKTLTEGRGADVVIVACSVAEAQQQALGYAGYGGRLLFFGGLPSGHSNITIDSNLIHYRELVVTGSHGANPPEQREALNLIASGEVAVADLITHRFALEDIQQAFLFAESHQGMKVSVYP